MLRKSDEGDGALHQESAEIVRVEQKARAARRRRAAFTLHSHQPNSHVVRTALTNITSKCTDKHNAHISIAEVDI